MRIRQAFVLGAGLGKRLRPLTEEMAKPLIPIFQKPLITFALDHLRAAGLQSFIINTHHLPEQFEELLGAATDVRLVHEPVLLETGGGIKNVEQWLGSEPFLVYSGDILTDIDLEPLLLEHFRAGNDVTLALRTTGLAQGVAFREGCVLDIGNRFGHAGTHDFANVSVWSPAVFERIPPNEKISFVPVLAEWIREGGRIGGVIANERSWFNIGSRAGYLEVHRIIDRGNWKPAYVRDPHWPVRVAPNAQVAPDAQLLGVCAIGAGAYIGAGTVLEDTIVWPGAQIASRSRLRNCIVCSHRKVEGTWHDIDL
jgi:NDP-sugar pyrophosphorylase family protein